MSQLISNMYLLMIAALLIGWFIGWYIRRSATRESYLRKIEELKIHDKNTSIKLHENSSIYENDLREIEHNKKRILFNETSIKDYRDKKSNLLSEIENFHTSTKKLEKDSLEIADKIEKNKKEIEALELHKDHILDSKKTIAEIESKIEKKENEIKKLKKDISELTTQRESSNSKVLYKQEKIKLKEKNIEELLQKIKTIEDEFNDKTAQIIEDEKSTRIKALNYKYALNYANERVEAKEPISFETIDKIISKNEETGLFENVIKKLFSKSAKYILGGK